MKKCILMFLVLLVMVMLYVVAESDGPMAENESVALQTTKGGKVFSNP
ncbi:hypothetical protein [Maribacter sp. 2307ULW6-5]